MRRLFLIAAMAAAASAVCAPAVAQDTFEASVANLASSSPTLRAAAVDFLKNQRSAAASEALLARMKIEPNAGLRARLVEAVDVNVSTTVFGAVAALLDDANPYIAQSAAIALGRCSDPERTAPLFERKLNDKAAPVRVKQSIVNSLGFGVSTTSLHLLDYVAGNTGNPSELRKMAVHSMGKMGTKEGTDKVRRYTNDKDPGVSGEAKKSSTPKTKK